MWPTACTTYQRRKNRTPASDRDIINTLPDECLTHILSRVDTPLPFVRMSATTHPHVRHTIHCALVCKRWADIAKHASEHLHFEYGHEPGFGYWELRTESMKVHPSLATSLTQFPALHTLSFIGVPLANLSSILRALALGSCPRLHTFKFICPHLGYSGGNSREMDLDGAEVAAALRRCPLLHTVVLQAERITHDWAANLALRGLPLLNHLDIWQGQGQAEPSAGDSFEGMHEGLTQLKSLCVTHGSGLPNEAPRLLAASVGALSSLETLTITNGTFTELPSTLGTGLGQLRVLVLNNLGRLEALPTSLGQLRNLQKMKVACMSLRALPESIGDLACLRVLHLSWCSFLEAIPASVGRLSALEKLTLRLCYSLRSMPESMGRLSRLRKLTVRSCIHLESLPEILGQLSSLETLTIQECRALRSLPESLGGLGALKRLDAQFDGPLHVPESLAALTALTWLRLHVWGSAVRLPESLGGLSSLESLDLDISPTERLPPSLGQLSTLTSLKVGVGVPLPETLGDLSALRCLTVRSCSHLPSSIGRLGALETLILDIGCLTSLPEAMGQLGRLQELHLQRFEELPVLPSSLADLPSLRKVVLETGEDVPEGHPSLTVISRMRMHGVDVLLSRFYHCFRFIE